MFNCAILMLSFLMNYSKMWLNPKATGHSCAEIPEMLGRRSLVVPGNTNTHILSLFSGQTFSGILNTLDLTV